MKSIYYFVILTLAAVPVCFAQSGTVSVVDSTWKVVHESAKKVETITAIPAPAMIDQNKNFQRNARENQIMQRSSIDPNEQTVDGRSAQLQKMSSEAQAPSYDAKIGYAYSANVKNDSDKTVVTIFFEYRFTEIETPTRVTSRHFICGVKIKPGDKRELAASSSLGPSSTISVESLASPTDKIFDEKVIINRIEFSDDSVLNRRDWKYDDHKDAIRRVTSKPWGKEVCRML